MSSNLLSRPHPDASKAVPEESQRITIDRLREMLPTKTTTSVTQEVVDLINRMEEDTGLPQELLEEDLMSYMYMLKDMRGVTVKDLMNAVKYCNLKRNYDNKEAWAIVFPDKYQRLIENNMQVDSHVSMYNAGKLVAQIDKEMLIPVHLQYAPYFHAAVKKQYEIMNGMASNTVDGKKQNVSPMVQHLAAKELATLTRQPEESKLSVTINPSSEALTAQGEMNEHLKQIVAAQRKQLEDGADIVDVQVLGIDFSDIGKPSE